MAEPEITQPVPFLEAFAREGDDAVHSRAAALLLLGAQMDEEPVAAGIRAAAEGVELQGELVPAEDLALLRVPVLAPTGERLLRERVRGLLGAQMDVEPEEIREARPEQLAELAALVE